jgi:hypothetical protein
MNNGTPNQARGSIKKPTNKMNGGNHTDEEEDQ